ncbi:MAG: nucleotidyltransferase, partial [Deltaproteobacteria bacterium]
SRLADEDPSWKSKQWTPVLGVPLLLRTVRSPEVAGCLEAHIVLGWNAETIEGLVRDAYRGPLELRFLFNKDYRLQNGLSVLCARPFIHGDFVLTMADHVLDDAIMERVRSNRPPDRGALLCVDYKLETVFDMDDATKVLEEEGKVKAIGKDLDVFNCVDTGVFLGTDGLMEAIAWVYRERGDASLSEGVQILAESGRMEVLDIGNAYWQDVDTPEMLAHAESMFRKGSPGDS